MNICKTEGGRLNVVDYRSGKKEFYEVLLADEKCTGIMVSAREMVEDYPEQIKEILGLEGGLSFKSTGVDSDDAHRYKKYSSADLAVLVNMGQNRAYLEQLYLENITPKVLVSTPNTPFIEYGYPIATVDIVYYGVIGQVDIYSNVAKLCKDFIKELANTTTGMYLVERRRPVLEHGFDAGGNCQWKISCRLGILPSAKL